MRDFLTEQEKFWAGEFGSEYSIRNNEQKLIVNNINFFLKALLRTEKIESVIEFGANVGMNLLALKKLFPKSEISAVEINSKAIEELEKMDLSQIYAQSILDFTPDIQRDLVFTKTFLIHIAPEYLGKVYELLYKTSKKYILIAEYYNTTPVEIAYRGYSERLYKRDFAMELQQAYPDLKLIDYGFVYHGDTEFPQDDITWFLFQK